MLLIYANSEATIKTLQKPKVHPRSSRGCRERAFDTETNLELALIDCGTFLVLNGIIINWNKLLQDIVEDCLFDFLEVSSLGEFSKRAGTASNHD